MAFDATGYKSEYAKQNYDRLLLTIPKGRKAELKAEADIRGISINQLIIDALEHYYRLDLSKKF